MTVNNVSEEEPHDSRHHGKGRGERERRDKSGRDDPPTAKSGIIRVEETMGAEERKSRFAISMAKIKAIGQMNAPLPLRGKKSLISKMLSWRSQLTTPRSHHRKSLRHQALYGLRPQIGQCHTQSSTTPRYHTRKH